MKNNNLHPILYACCVPVEGVSRSIIYDLQRLDYIFIPNTLFEILDKYRGLTLQNIQNKYDIEHSEDIENYFNFLQTKEYLFYTDTPNLFPKMGLEWDNPALIYTATLCIQKNAVYNLEYTLQNLLQLGCRHFLFVIEEVWDIADFTNLLLNIKNNYIFSLEINTQYNPCIIKEQWFTFISAVPQIFAINFYNAPFSDFYKKNEQAQMGNIHFYTKDIPTQGISPNKNHFTTNIAHFTESQTYNTFYNRTVCIDKNGYIKNGLHTDRIFGNIGVDEIDIIVKKDNFQQLWFSNKDNIAVCKDCEFRYMCTDSCIPVFDENAKVYKIDTLCDYNPYETVWKNELIQSQINP